MRLKVVLMIIAFYSVMLASSSLPSYAISDRLGPNQKLMANQYLQSPNGLCQIWMQSDGNLVLYYKYGTLWVTKWASNTAGNPGAFTIMQSVGNLVVYDRAWHPLWASSSVASQASNLVLQNDGNLVIYDNATGKATWSLGTIYETGLGPNQKLTSGHYLTSQNGTSRLYMQTDGNFVLYYLYGTLWVARWASNTAGHPGAFAIMQKEGNLVVYDSAWHPLWASSSTAGPISALILKNNGELKIVDKFTKRWSLGTLYEPGLGPDQKLTAGHYLHPPNGLIRLWMQSDGNLVLYYKDGPSWIAKWASNTAGHPGAFAIMQKVGNLVVYDSAWHPLWASTSIAGQISAFVVQNDGNLVIYNRYGGERWASNTFLQPTSDGFDFPVGWPDGDGWRVDNPFSPTGHSGEDWNYGSGDNDLNKPVSAVADGYVWFSDYVGDGPNNWGNVIIVRHDTPHGVFTSLYAHLNSRLVLSEGAFVSRGQQIGTVGKTGGPWGEWNSAHLHFEIRIGDSHSTGNAVGTDEGQIDPSDFISSHRP
jgi:murein DD-endopeptidase MepM/ murein hydrolase activator NlpD